MQFSYLKVFLVLTLIESLVPNISYFCGFFLLAYKFCKSGLWVMLYISDTSRYTNIVYIGIYLVDLVMAYKERLFSTVCFFFTYFWAFSYFIYIRAFSIVIYGKLISSYPLFVLAFFMWSVNCASLIYKDIWFDL